jgi:hypothetical protein
MNKKIALVSPVIGEFGWTVFDIQQKVRKFFEDRSDHTKIVLASSSLSALFELADEVIEFEYPTGFLSCGRGSDDGLFNNIDFYNNIHETCMATYEPDVYLKIPYENRFGLWDVPFTEKKFYADPIIPDDKYITISCRNISRGAIKNWSLEKYNELVNLVRKTIDLPIYLVGLPEDNHCPDGVIIPETKTVNDHISLLANASLHFGSNTGTSHLALLCGCPMFSWGLDQSGLKKRMLVDTNPFETSSLFVGDSWNPSVDVIYKELNSFIDKLNIMEKV